MDELRLNDNVWMGQYNNSSPRFLSDGGQAHNGNWMRQADSWFAKNKSMIQGILDIENESGFGEGEDWAAKGNDHHIHEYFVEQPETKSEDYEECTGRNDASGGINLKLIDATEMPSRVQAADQIHLFLASLLEKKESNNEALEAVCIARKSSPNNLHERKEGSEFLRILWKHFERVAAKEKVVEETLGNEKVEYLVSMVEDVVKFEVMMDELWLRIKANRDDLEMVRLENNRETERHEPQLYEADMLKEKVRRLEEDVKIAQEEKNCALWKAHGTGDKIAHNTLQQCRDQEGANCGANIGNEMVIGDVVGERRSSSDWPSKTKAQAFDDMFTEAEQRSSDDRQALKIILEANHEQEDYFLQRDTDKKLEFLEEQDSVVGTEKIKSKEFQLQAHKVLEVEGGEVKRYKESSYSLKEKASEMNSMVQAGPESEVTPVDFFKGLVNLQIQGHQNSSDWPKHACRSFKDGFMERLRDKRDELEAERVRLENELNLAMTQAREIEDKNEALWLEKERHFKSEVTSVQAKADHLEELIEKMEADHIQERSYWEDEIEMCRDKCKNENDILYSTLRENEQKLRKESEIWSRLLEAKEEKLAFFESAVKKVAQILTANMHHVAELRKQLSQGKGYQKDLEIDIEDEESYSCPEGSDFKGQYRRDVPEMKEQGLDITLFVENLSTYMETEIGRLSVEIRQEHDRLKKERDEARLCTAQMNQERMELEKKFSETVSVMNHLKGQMIAKEGQMDWERKQVETLLMMKSAEIEKLRGELNSMDQEQETTTQKLQDEIAMIEKEFDNERKERQKVIDLYLSSRQKMIQEIREKEEIWEQQMQGLTGDFFKLKEENLNKDHEMEMLREEINDILKHFDDEKRWSMAALKDIRNVRMGGQPNQQEIQVSSKQLFRDHGRSLVEQVTFLSRSPKDSNIDFPCFEDEDNGFVHIKKADFDALCIAYFDHKQDICRQGAELQHAIAKITEFDSQITDAMIAIQNLSEELHAKETDLQIVRLEQDAGFEGDLAWR